ncbi:hypothetical protein [Gordonia sihwensis]|uniref:hypothetical protein n=1 Tax=Gordonia sihwensis TaxID=173559 RepID=UPI0012E04605|nr:hypothetical protein [Gordonia sihwensis]
MTTDSAEDAYRQACADAAHEDGHGAYSGTIATTYGVRVVPGVKPMTMTEARTVIDKRLDDLNKWDVCEAIPLVAETPAVYERGELVDLTITVPGSVFNDRHEMAAVIAKKLRLKADQIENYEVVRDHLGKEVMTVSPRVRATAPVGKPVKRYFIIDPYYPQLPDFTRGYTSQAEARKALADQVHASCSGVTREKSLEIIAITRRDNGDPLVEATVTVKSVTATLKVHTRKKTAPATRGKDRAGWLFFGWAAC